MEDGFSCNLSYTSNPSFSSTLLDEIYRSIDKGEEEIESMRKKDSSQKTGTACMIEKWMEKKMVDEKDVARKKSAGVRKFSKDEEFSSSGGCGAGFLSSSDAEYFKGKRPKPIRVVGDSSMSEKDKPVRHEKPSKKQDGFLKTKSRALKIYSELRKAKEPISPGARLAGFLNSLFTGSAGNPKKPKSEIKSANTSSCSSASSFSRSCLSKTPSSTGNSTSTEKRSVRFSPLNLIVDEDFRPINPKKQNLEAINEDILVHALEKNRRVEEAARDLLRTYQKKMDTGEFPFQFKNQSFDQEFDDDAASYASSDLFELDNLSAIGIGYNEELPVYETTYLHTNRAISNGLLL